MTRRVKNVPTSTRKAVCLSTGELTWGCVGMELEEACGTRRTERVENQTNQQNKLENRLIRCILDAGEVILKSGGEINRVEDTMARMCRAYGFVRTDVFTITSSIVITVYTAGGEILTQTRRIRGYDMNLDRIHQMNQLAREVCETPIEVGELERRIREIQNTKELEPWKMMLLYGANAAVFSVFFGGGPAEALFGALTGMGLCLLLGATEHIFTNEIVCYAFCSALGGLFLGLIRKYVMAYAVDPALMGNIMLLIPGIPFTNSIRDMLSGDTMSGLLRMCECLLRTVAVAAGFVGVMTLLGVAGI